MGKHLTEIVTVQFISYASIPFRAEIYADELQIDWGDGHYSVYTGQEYYPITYCFQTEGLRHIRILGSNISYLDVSGINLPAIDLEACPNLGCLNCSANELLELNLKHCPVLQELYCNSNNLQTIDLVGNPEICLLQLSYNYLGNLELSHCGKLKALYCSNNYLRTLDIKGCHWLCDVDISANSFDTEQAIRIFKQLPARAENENAVIRYHSNPLQDDDCDDILVCKNWH